MQACSWRCRWAIQPRIGSKPRWVDAKRWRKSCIGKSGNRRVRVSNADMGVSEIQELCVLHPDARQMLDIAVRRMSLSARLYHRVVKLSRTIADLADCEFIQVEHVAEAIQYRPKAQNGQPGLGVARG
ncbi:MAG: hypothetical protein IPK19_07685 [Chloroflexi bacterium]|nr:hypothetical protein [Chloroflexota bacterium]